MAHGGELRKSFPDWRAFIAVPLLLCVLDAFSKVVRGKPTEFLLVPPLAVVAYVLFSRPEDADTRLRAVVLLPVIAALTGEIGYRLLGPTPWGILVVLLVVLIVQRALRATMPPALAIAVLAMFLEVRGPWYPLDVALGTAFVWLAFRGWRLFARRTPSRARPRERGQAPSSAVEPGAHRHP